jgi:hypothetical protein
MSDEKKISPLPWKFSSKPVDDNLFGRIESEVDGDITYLTLKQDKLIANGEFIVKACNSYHDNQKIIDEQAKKIEELEEFVKEITTYKTTDRIKEDINFMLDSGRSCPTFEQTLEAIYKSIKSKAKQLLGSE